MSRIPWPVPDATKLPDHRYKDVFESCGDECDDSRSPDVWQLRHNIKKKTPDLHSVRMPTLPYSYA